MQAQRKQNKKEVLDLNDGEVLMLTSFLSKKAMMRGVKVGQDFGMRSISQIAQQNPKKISEGQEALNHVELLCKNGQYTEALKEIDWIEKTYPSCTKGSKYYRGEAAYALLEKMGHLKNLPPSV